ncbi:MAG: AAA family ATPase, partial [Chromatocurvus sp.]
MRIHRLALRSWRAIAEREITLSEGVTLIEGANEIGKSTLVEALRMLFREQDSSKKREVKAIQPVGEDVGSRVEAEIECGDVHFTYSKTYNRQSRTELRIHTPRAEQLTGGDAHNRVRAILDEHLDIGLWETLLVEQGQALGTIKLADSSGLAQALDSASGGQGRDGDGSVLLEAARTEYERYFTPSAGKERFLEQVADVQGLESEVARLRDSLQTLYDDLLTLERLEEDIRHRRQSQPDLQANEQELSARWAAIDRLEGDIARAEEAREPLEKLLNGAIARRDVRQRQAQESASIQARIQELSTRLDPQAAILARQKAAVGERRDTFVQVRQRRRQQQESEQRAQKDLQYLADTNTRRDIEERLQRLGELSARAGALRQQRDAIIIDEQGRRDIQAAHNAMALAGALRDRASTRLELEAAHELQFVVDGQPQTLPAQETLEHHLTQPMRLELPGGVVIRLTPGSGE